MRPLPTLVMNPNPLATPATVLIMTQTWKVSRVMITTSESSERGGILSELADACYRYHAFVDCPYPLPNDDEEIARLTELQFVMRAVLGRNVLAKINKEPACIGIFLSVAPDD